MTQTEIARYINGTEGFLKLVLPLAGIPPHMLDEALAIIKTGLSISEKPELIWLKVNRLFAEAIDTRGDE
jgi:hypothetical protein